MIFGGCGKSLLTTDHNSALTERVDKCATFVRHRRPRARLKRDEEQWSVARGQWSVGNRFSSGHWPLATSH